MGWEEGLDTQIKGFGKGWSLRKHRDRFLIIHRPGGVQKSAPLGLKWHESNSGEAFLRAEEIRKLVKKGSSIKEASKKLLVAVLSTRRIGLALYIVSKSKK